MSCFYFAVWFDAPSPCRMVWSGSCCKTPITARCKCQCCGQSKLLAFRVYVFDNMSKILVSIALIGVEHAKSAVSG